MARNKVFLAGCALVAVLATAGGAAAQKHYDQGVTDSEIKLGHTLPLSGPASSTADVGLAEAAYFDMLNAAGGVNGRKINLIALDDSYNPAKTVEMTRQLVEQDGIFVDFATQGTPPNVAIQKYLMEKKVPQLFIGSGASRWNDPKHFPATIPGLPSYAGEARAYARYILQTKPDARVAILYQNDDYGRDYVTGVKQGLGDKASKMLVAEQSYEVSDPTVDSQIISLKSSGADAIVLGATPKAAAQAIRKIYDLGWHPLTLVSYISNSVGAVMEAAGPERSTGVISAFIVKDPTDPQWKDDKATQDYIAWMKKWYKQANIADSGNVIGYNLAQLMVEVLKRCGDDLTHNNVVAQATHLDNLSLPMLFPGITITITPEDYNPYRKLQLERFDGKRWVTLGAPISG